MSTLIPQVFFRFALPAILVGGFLSGCGSNSDDTASSQSGPEAGSSAPTTSTSPVATESATTLAGDESQPSSTLTAPLNAADPQTDQEFMELWGYIDDTQSLAAGSGDRELYESVSSMPQAFEESRGWSSDGQAFERSGDQIDEQRVWAHPGDDIVVINRVLTVTEKGHLVNEAGEHVSDYGYDVGVHPALHVLVRGEDGLWRLADKLHYSEGEMPPVFTPPLELLGVTPDGVEVGFVDVGGSVCLSGSAPNMVPAVLCPVDGQPFSEQSTWISVRTPGGGRVVLVTVSSDELIIVNDRLLHRFAQPNFAVSVGIVTSPEGRLWARWPDGTESDPVIMWSEEG